MRVVLVVLAVLVLAPVVLAQEDAVRDEPVAKEIEKQFTKARIAEKEGQLERAIEQYETVIREWPDDREWTPKAYAQMVFCLVRLGRHDAATRLVRAGFERFEDLAVYEQWAKKALKEIEVARARDEEELHAKKAEDEEMHLRRQIEELERAWKEQGLGREEIEARIDKVRMAQVMTKRIRQQYAEEAARMRKLGYESREIRRRVAELEREKREIEEIRWRKDHDRGMDEARREFLHLAERLGIPPDKAERFLEEHRRARGPEVHLDRDARRMEDGMREAHEAIEEARERLHHHERALEHVERRLEKFEHHLERVMDVLNEGRERIERLEHALEGFHGKLIPHLKKMEERLQKMEKAVREAVEKK